MEVEKYITTLTHEDQKYACEILKENLETLDDTVSEFRNWLKLQENLNAKTDAVTIVRFLRGCKYDVEKAKKKIKCFYELRGNSPEWFENRNPLLPELQELLKLGVFLPLLKKDPEGRTVIIIRVAAHNPTQHKQSDIFKIGKMILDLAIDRDETIAVYGVIAIFDLNSVTASHATKLTPAMIKKAVHSWQDCYPVSPKSLDFINTPIYINVVLNIFKRFMKTEIRNRVHVHGFNLCSLHSIVPKHILPEEYGGTDGKLHILIDYWRENLSSSQEWFSNDAKYKARVQ